MKTETTMLKEYHDERGAAVLFAIFAAMGALAFLVGAVSLFAMAINAISKIL